VWAVNVAERLVVGFVEKLVFLVAVCPSEVPASLCRLVDGSCRPDGFSVRMSWKLALLDTVDRRSLVHRPLHRHQDKCYVGCCHELAKGVLVGRIEVVVRTSLCERHEPMIIRWCIEESPFLIIFSVGLIEDEMRVLLRRQSYSLRSESLLCALEGEFATASRVVHQLKLRMPICWVYIHAAPDNIEESNAVDPCQGHFLVVTVICFNLVEGLIPKFSKSLESLAR
jgi:hypothetical protein